MNFIFTNPRNYKILYIRNNTSQELPKFLKNKKILNIYSLETLQNLYLFILIKAISISLFSINNKIKFKTRLKINYYKVIFQRTNPKVVVSTNEGDPLFYFLKNSYNKSKFLIIQNGRKNHNYIINIIKEFKNKNGLPSPELDYFFCYGTNIANNLGNLLLKKTKFITHGSSVNNDIKVNSYKRKKYICIISEVFKPETKEFLSEIFNNKLISFDDYYKAEKFILPKIINFFHNKNIKIKIITRSNYSNSSYIKKFEKNFFNFLNKKNVKKLNFSCDSNISLKQKYQLTDNSILNFGFGVSSMDFEILSRGNKFCFLNYRGRFLKELKYGNCGFWYWPLKIKNFIYTLDELNEKKINIYLNKLLKIKNNYFSHKNFLENFITFDYKNSRFKKVLMEIVK